MIRPAFKITARCPAALPSQKETGQLELLEGQGAGLYSDSKMIQLLACFSLLISSSMAVAEVTFEGFYRIENAGEHVGFSVVREDMDPKTKITTVRYFIVTTDRDHKLHEVKSISTHDAHFIPLTSDYVEKTEGQAVERLHVRIDLTGKNYHYVKQQDSIQKQGNGKLKDNEFLRPMTEHVLLLNHLKKGKAYTYDVFRDDEAAHRGGQVQVLDEATVHGHKLFQILDDAEMHPQENWLADNGQVLLSRLPKVSVTSKLVSNFEAAVGQIPFERSELLHFFPEMPKGERNLVAEHQVVLGDVKFKTEVDTHRHVIPGAMPIRLPN
jgi:hypothetical protein